MTSVPSSSPLSVLMTGALVGPDGTAQPEIDLIDVVGRPVDLLASPACTVTTLRSALQRTASTVRALDERDSQGRNALMLAAGLGREDLVRLLLDVAPPGRSPQALAEDVHGLTALMHAVKAGVPPVVSHLLPVSNPNAQSSLGCTALMLAAEQPHEALVPLLLPVSASVLNRRNHDGQTALMLAAHAGQPLNVAALLTAGADASLRNPKGATALHQAAWNGQAETVALLARPPERLLERTNAQGPLPLDLALRRYNLAAAAVLVARMPSAVVLDVLNHAVEQDPSVYSRFEGLFPVGDLLAPRTVWGSAQALDLSDVRLRRAAQVGDLTTVQTLLAHGADPCRGETGQPFDGMDALTLACLGASAAPPGSVGPEPSQTRAVVHELLAIGVDPNGAGTSMTPMLAACQDHRWEVVSDLLDAGASHDLYRNFPDAPEALRRQRLTLLHRFLQHEGDPGRALPQRTPAARLAVVQTLLAAGVDPNARYDDRHRHRQDLSPLLLAVEGLHEDVAVVAALLAAGAHPDPLSRWGRTDEDVEDVPTGVPWPGQPGLLDRVESRWTPLAAAASTGQVEVCRLLVEHGAHLHHRLDQDASPWPDPFGRPSPPPRPPEGLGVSIVGLLHQGGWPKVAAYLEDVVLRRSLNEVWGHDGPPDRARPRL